MIETPKCVENQENHIVNSPDGKNKNKNEETLLNKDLSFQNISAEDSPSKQSKSK